MRARPLEDCWIVNLLDRMLEVHRDPTPAPEAVYGWRYASVARLASPAVIVPLALLACRVAPWPIASPTSLTRLPPRGSRTPVR